jgi:hypothetical protein
VKERQSVSPRQQQRSIGPVFSGPVGASPTEAAESGELARHVSLTSRRVRAIGAHQSADPTPRRYGQRIPPRGRKYRPGPPNLLERVARVRNEPVGNRRGSGRSCRQDGSAPRVISIRERDIGEHVHPVADDL